MHFRSKLPTLANVIWNVDIRKSAAEEVTPFHFLHQGKNVQFFDAEGFCELQVFCLSAINHCHTSRTWQTIRNNFWYQIITKRYIYLNEKALLIFILVFLLLMVMKFNKVDTFQNQNVISPPITFCWSNFSLSKTLS